MSSRTTTLSRWNTVRRAGYMTMGSVVTMATVLALLYATPVAAAAVRRLCDTTICEDEGRWLIRPTFVVSPCRCRKPMRETAVSLSTSNMAANVNRSRGCG